MQPSNANYCKTPGLHCDNIELAILLSGRLQQKLTSRSKLLPAEISALDMRIWTLMTLLDASNAELSSVSAAAR